MNDLIWNVVKRQKIEFELLRGKKRVPRTQLKTLKKALPSSLIKVITGPRRAGKSTLAVQALGEKRCAYLNFEDEDFPQSADGDDLIAAMKSVYGDVDFYLFDEIQNLPRWEQFLNRLHRLGYNLIVTGSNAKLLGEELGSALTGRHIAIELLPFSFSEKLAGTTADEGDFANYLLKGGFPEVTLGADDPKSYLRTLWESVILRDIVQRYKVRNVGGLRELLSLFLSTMSSRYSYESLARALSGRVSAPSLKKFIRYGCEAYLVAELTAYHHKPRVRIKSDRKAYTVDNGFFSAHHIGVSDDHSKRLENLVFVELWRRGYRPNLDLFYFQTSGGYEVDFLLRSGHKSLELIQVSYSLSSGKTREREFRALIRASEELKIIKRTVITMNEDRRESVGGHDINVISAARWCQGGE